MKLNREAKKMGLKLHLSRQALTQKDLKKRFYLKTKVTSKQIILSLFKINILAESNLVDIENEKSLSSNIKRMGGDYSDKLSQIFKQTRLTRAIYFISSCQKLQDFCHLTPCSRPNSCCSIPLK